MESNDQTPGQAVPVGGETQPAAPVAPVASPPAQTSGEPAQDERYWQSQYDTLVNSKEYKDKQQLWGLYEQHRQPDGSNPLVAHTMEFFNRNKPSEPAQPAFDPSVEFDVSDLPNPNSPTGQFFNARVQEVAGSLVDQKLQKLEQAQQRQSHEQFLITQKGYTAEQARKYVDSLTNPSEEFVQEFLLGRAAEAFVAAPPGATQTGAPPAGQGLGPVSGIQLPPTGGVQGAQPAPKSEADKMFDRIQAASGGPLPLK